MGGRPSTYTTRQGEAVLAYLASQKGRHVTAAQVAEHLGNIIGRTTVYRQLDRLVREGRLRRYMLDEAAGACFQYVEENEGAGEHFHLKCEACGKLIHMDGKALPDVTGGILQHYAFEVDVNRTVFYGRCRACSGKGHP